MLLDILTIALGITTIVLACDEYAKGKAELEAKERLLNRKLRKREIEKRRIL